MASSSKNVAAKIWLARKEEHLRETLNQGDMPVLGLYADPFSPKDRDFFRSTVLGLEDPLRAFIRGLKKWPATFATLLTVHLVEAYGKSGNARVYPYILNALGITGESLTQSQKDRLAAAYRGACISLGLSVAPKKPGPRRPVDEYLRQVGVPVAYFEGLFKSFAAQAQQIGVPEIEDTNDLAMWQLAVHVPPERPVLQRAIDNDLEGYYAGLFLRVSAFQEESQCVNSIELAAFRALEGIDRSIGKGRTFIPSLNWRDGELGILLPASDNMDCRISVVGLDGQTYPMPNIQARSEPIFAPISIRLPERCEVISSTLSVTIDVWDSVDDNRFLVFDRAGKFVASGRLGGNPIAVNPGVYTIISRWNPEELGNTTYAVSDEIALYSSQIELAAGQGLELHRGAANIQISARSVPSIFWHGQRLVGITGKEIYWGADLAVRVTIPEEFREGAVKGFELVVRKSNGEEGVVSLSDECGGSVDVPIGQLLADMGAGLKKIRIRLRRPEIPNRSLASINGFAWPELKSVVVGRLTGESPAAFGNLEKSASDNVQLQGTSLTYIDPTQRFYRTVFKIDTEDFAFQWPVPGVFLALEDGAGGAHSEKAIEKGDNVQVRPGSRQRLKIYSADDGILRLGDFSQPIKSSVFGGSHVYLSNLIEYISPEQRTLQLEIPGWTHLEELVRIVTPHEAVEFSSTRSGESYTLVFCVSGELTEVSLDAWDLLSGKREELRIQADAISLSGNPFQRACLTTNKEGHFSRAALVVSAADWEDGAWLLQIQARIDGRWGKLLNSRGDVYAGGFCIPVHNTAKLHMEETPTQQAIHIFGRFTEALLECYALESWQDLKWLEREWHSLAQYLDPMLEKHAHALLSMAFKKAPETSTESWVPIKSVSAQLTELFGLAVSSYEGFQGASVTTNSVLGAGNLGLSRDDEIVRQTFFDPFFPLAFQNVKEVESGQSQSLRGFSYERFLEFATYVGESEYRRIIYSSDWAPAAGFLLGARHYWWAVKRLELAFGAAKEHNDFRKGNALRLADRLATIGLGAIHPEFRNPAIINLRSLGLMNPWIDTDSLDPDSPNIVLIALLISALALAARLSARHDGFLTEVKRSLCDHADFRIDQFNAVIGFILYVGADLFVFYLGLWEFVLARDYDAEN